MPTKRGSGSLSRIVLVLLFVFIASALVEQSEQLGISRSSSAESLCLRRCLLRAVKRSNAKVLKLSCYNRCINKITKDQPDLTAKVFKQRIRKALKPIPECRDSSPDQSVDWTPREVNVTFGQYDNTSHWYVNVSWTAMNDSSGNWTGILVRLVVPSFKRNNIPIFPTICSVHPKNQTFLNINISSYQYQYPDTIFLRILALPYTSKEDLAPAAPYEPQIPTSPPTKVQTTVVTASTTVNLTTGVSPTTATKSSCSPKEYGDLVWEPSNVDGRFLKGSNGDWFANISWTPLENSTVTWTGYLLYFYFGRTGQGKPKCFKVPKNQTFYIVDSSHGWKYPQSISVVVNAYPFKRQASQDMILFYPTVQLPATIAPASPTTPGNSDVIITVFASVGGFFTLLLASVFFVVLRKRRRPSVNVADEPRSFKYHVFIIYSMTDSSDFVDNILIPVLEKHFFKYCIHWKDFVPGDLVTENIVNCVHNSFKIVALVSRNFFMSHACQYELGQAEHRLMNRGDDCLILFKLDDAEIPLTLLNRSYIDFTKATDISTWESKLVDVLKTADIVEDDSVHSEGNANNNHLPAGNSTDNDGRELICSCQSAV